MPGWQSDTQQMQKTSASWGSHVTEVACCEVPPTVGDGVVHRLLSRFSLVFWKRGVLATADDTGPSAVMS